jgi:serine phosphatase RsbU (regulator of sigma subunit)
MDAMTASAQTRATPTMIAWGARARSFADAEECGDLDIVVASRAGAVIALADGLGHGREAAVAARQAAAVIGAHADSDVVDLMRLCHEGLRSTRGAALSIAAFACSDATMTWVAVGNVDGVLVRADPSAQPERHGLLLRGGVVGYRMPPLRAEVLPIFPGDTLIMATDGISSQFGREQVRGRDPQSAADDILARHGKQSDDALVLVARYLGRAS